MKTNKLTIGSKIAHPISSDMIGLFFEDINFAADGGLYAELIENRNFEALCSRGNNRNYYIKEDSLYAWSSANGDESELDISMNMAVCEKNPHYLRFTAKEAMHGFANKAYDGLCLKKGMTYKISFYAREVSYLTGEILVKLAKDGVSYGESRVAVILAQPREPDDYDGMMGNCEAKKWRKYETSITATADVKGASFEVYLTEAGCLEFDLFSMIPEDAVAGLFRKDLFEALKGLNPGFLRFPGGCIVEGTSLHFRYRWKETVGALDQRKACPNLWATTGGNTTFEFEMPDSHYMQTYGIGFYEYFLLCELLSSEKRSCKPLPVLNIGVACQFRSYETVPVGSPEFEEYVQDALDLIEFANGDVSTKWGALRAAMGHPKSFGMEYLAIGNEQWESRHVDVAERYIRFEKAIHAVYPEIKCLGTAGAFVGNDLHGKAWDFYREKAAENPSFAYAVDEHYYVAPQWLYEHVDFYDEYPREVAVFAGEYAAHDQNQSNSVEAALAEAAMMTGMERNGDVVKLASYAPLLNRIGHSHWTPDMIWFDEEQVILTPSYFAQKLFSDYAGEYALDLLGQEKELRKEELYISLVKMGEKTVLKVVNATAEDQKLELVGEDGSSITASAEVATMRAESGIAKEVVATKATPVENNHMVPLSVVSNKELCELRGPEACSYTVEQVQIAGSIMIPAKSLMAVCLS